MRKRRTRLKKLHRFHFLLFSPTTSKKPSRFTRNFGSQSRRLFTDRDEDGKITQTSSARWPSLAGPGWPARPPGPAGGGQAGPHLAGRWAASREGNEGRAQEGAQRAGADGAPPLLSPQVGYLV